jgi:hypothetical protein
MAERRDAERLRHHGAPARGSGSIAVGSRRIGAALHSSTLSPLEGNTSRSLPGPSASRGEGPRGPALPSIRPARVLGRSRWTTRVSTWRVRRLRSRICTSTSSAHALRWSLLTLQLEPWAPPGRPWRVRPRYLEVSSSRVRGSNSPLQRSTSSLWGSDLEPTRDDIDSVRVDIEPRGGALVGGRCRGRAAAPRHRGRDAPHGYMRPSRSTGGGIHFSTFVDELALDRPEVGFTK